MIYVQQPAKFDSQRDRFEEIVYKRFNNPYLSKWLLFSYVTLPGYSFFWFRACV